MNNNYNIALDIEKFANDDERLALIWENELGEMRQLTYCQLFLQANQFANALKKANLKKGDTIIIILSRVLETYVAYLGALKLGLVISPGSEMLRESDLQFRMKHSQAKLILTNSSCSDVVDTVCEQINFTGMKVIVSGEKEGWEEYNNFILKEETTFTDVNTVEDDLAFLNYTSGTTGPPKGVLMHHGWAKYHREAVAELWMGINEGDIVWATASPGWAKWNWTPLVSILGSGATGYVYDGKFSPNKYLELISKRGINVLCCTPTEYRFMAKVNNLNEYEFSNLRSAVSAGEPLNRAVFDIFKKYFNIDVRDGYGQTEHSLVIANLLNSEIKIGSMGRPTPGHIVEIIDEEGNVLPEGTVGNIGIDCKAKTLFKGYLDDEKRTDSAYVGSWYVTGDRAKKDSDGYFWFQGRNDDIIISSGYTIGPYEVEDALLKHPNIKECAVVASPDEMRGAIVKAFVVLQPNVIGNEGLVFELQQFAKKQTAPYKYPRKIEFVSSLPKTVSGKTRRVELRDAEYTRC